MVVQKCTSLQNRVIRSKPPLNGGFLYLKGEI